MKADPGAPIVKNGAFLGARFERDPKWIAFRYANHVAQIRADWTGENATVLLRVLAIAFRRALKTGVKS